MRAPRSWKYFAVLSFISLVVISAFLAPARAEQVNAWTPIANYPVTHSYASLPANGSLGIESESCVTATGYVYCVGGSDSYGVTNNTIYANLTQLGIKPWSQGTDYPKAVEDESCVTSGGYIYCVGGDGIFGIGNDTAQTYFAPISTSGIGAWTATTDYPVPTYSADCVSASSYIYCLGGNETGTIPEPTYYAALSSSGIGPWKPSTGYPDSVQDEQCAVSGSVVYCVGGRMVGGPTNATLFAQLSSSGIGAWQNATDYPFDIGDQACVALSSYLYCISGQRDTLVQVGETVSYPNASVYFAPITSSGLGAWTQTTAYPEIVDEESCVASTYIYCIGGSVYVKGYGSATSGGVYSSGPPNSITVTNTGTLITSTTSIVKTTTIYSSTLVTYTTSTSTRSKNYLGEQVFGYALDGVLLLIPVTLLLIILVAARSRRKDKSKDGTQRSDSSAALVVLIIFFLLLSGFTAGYFLYPDNVNVTGVNVHETYFAGTYKFSTVTPTYFDSSPQSYPTTVNVPAGQSFDIDITITNNDTAPHYIYDIYANETGYFALSVVSCAGCFSVTNATLISAGDNYGVPPNSSVTLTLQLTRCDASQIGPFGKCFKHYSGPLDLTVQSSQ